MNTLPKQLEEMLQSAKRVEQGLERWEADPEKKELIDQIVPDARHVVLLIQETLRRYCRVPLTLDLLDHFH